MLTVSKDVVLKLIEGFRTAQVRPQQTHEGGRPTLTFTLPDITLRVTRSEKVEFDGMMVKLFERFFFVESDFTITLVDEEGDPMPLTDEGFVYVFETYLRLRLLSLKSFGL